jgi:hypothetical protein
MVTAILSPLILIPGCTCKKEPELLVAPKMTLIKKNIIDEDKLKRELEIIHPVLRPDKQSRYQLYVTPNASAVAAVANRMDGAEPIYQTAVQWIWVSEQTLNQTQEKWLMPREFLMNTPNYPTNPVKGEVVSDCEEQANTLVSVLRADGIPPANARAVLGKVKFGDEEGGHAWVEVKHNGKWLPLEATSGPYWNDEDGKLVNSKGFPFNYYSSHAYPVIEIWAYYNDIYYLDPRTGEGNAPEGWGVALLQSANQ